MKETEVKLTRTLHNQLIIGKTDEADQNITIHNPYNVMPGVDGINLFKMDFEIVGKEIKEITLPKSILMYCTEPSQELINTYLKDISGIIA